MIVISARPFEEYFETVPNVSCMAADTLVARKMTKASLYALYATTEVHRNQEKSSCQSVFESHCFKRWPDHLDTFFWFFN